MSENILNFPDFTIVNRVVPKTAFYKHLEVNARMKTLFVKNVEQIVWLYKLAPSNLHISDGKEVHEIAVFYVVLRKSADEIIHFIDSQMPRHALFILQQGEQYQLLVNYKQWKDAQAGTFDIIKTFVSDWRYMDFTTSSSPVVSLLSIKAESLTSMDTLYESLVRQVASSQITSSKEDLQQAVAETQETETLRKELEAIKRKEQRERQPQKKFALHQQYIRLKRKLKHIHDTSVSPSVLTVTATPIP